MLCFLGWLGPAPYVCGKEELTPLCFVVHGGHSGSSHEGLNGATGSIRSWILVSELAVKHLQQLVVSESFPGSGSII